MFAEVRILESLVYKGFKATIDRVNAKKFKHKLPVKKG